MDKSIYLDWNVFQDIFQNRNNYSSEVKEKCEEFRKKGFKIIYSSVHMQDLSRCKSKEYVQNDMEKLSKFTENWCVGLRTNTDIIIYQKIKPSEVMNQVIIANQKSTQNIERIGAEFVFEPFKVDTSKISDEHILLPFLNNGYMTPEGMQKFIEFIKATENGVLNNYKSQKQFRKSLEEGRTVNEPAFPIVQDLAFYDLLLQPKDEIISNLKEVINSFLSISCKDFDSIGLAEKITTTYQLLDFFPAFSEKLDKRNTQRNINNDANHAFMASNSMYLICGDESMVEKVKCIYNLCDIKTKVLTPEQFINNIYLL